MSLIVLNSHGQDPAEFENHFGRGLKLPRNAEICLCGANLNRYNKQDEAVIIQDNNDAFIVLVSGGSANPQDYAPFGAYAVKLKAVSFTFGDVGSQLSNALAVGNYLYGTKNYMDIPVSPFRVGLLSIYDATNKKMKFLKYILLPIQIIYSIIIVSTGIFLEKLLIITITIHHRMSTLQE